MTISAEKNSKKIKICSLTALAFAVLAIILRTSCLLWFYDEEIGYYTRDILPAIFEVFCVIAVVLFAGIFFILKACDKTSDGKEDNLALEISSALAAIAFTVFFIFSVSSTSFVTSNVVFDLALKISALSSIVYFAINLFTPHINRVAQTALGFGMIIWGACVLAVTYFDIYVQINSPEKIILHLALVSCMAFFASEFRCFISGVRSKLYLFTAFCAVFFSGACSVPYIIACFCGVINGEKHFFYNVVLVALFVYASTRLMSFSFAAAKEDEKTEVSDASEE